jgi:hypothetical protein
VADVQHVLNHLNCFTATFSPAFAAEYHKQVNERT